MLRSSMAQAKKGRILSPGHVAQLARASSLHTNVAGSIPHQGTSKKQPMKMSGTTSECFSLSLPCAPSPLSEIKK